MNREIKIRKVKEYGIILLFLVVIGVSWYIIFKAKKEVPSNLESKPLSFEIRGRAAIPYFILALDRSGSMKETDPENFETESLKQIIRLIYFNSKQLYKATGLYPKVRLISFSGSPTPFIKEDGWHKLASESDVEFLDKRTDELLSDRNGQFTDINSVVEYMIGAYKDVPRQLGQENETRPTSVIAILFTDGGIYPNFLNLINHKSVEQWKNFKNDIYEMASRSLGRTNTDKMLRELNHGKWLDPIDWVFTNEPSDIAKRFKSAFYIFNDSLQSTSYYTYAKNDVQNILYNQLISFRDPAFRFNVVALLKTGPGSVEDAIQIDGAKNYLNNWSSKLGGFYHVQDASILGKVFIDIMSDYLNIYSESFSVDGEKQIGPFSQDVVEAQLMVVFPIIIEQQKQDMLVKLYSPSNKIVSPSLNSIFEHSRSYFLSKDQFTDFYNENGWRLVVNPVSINGDIINRVKCTLITIHGYVLDIQPDAEFNKVQKDITRYIIRLVKLKDRQFIPLNNFEKMMKFKTKTLNVTKKLPEIIFSSNSEKDGINADFAQWPSGSYTVQFRMVDGRLKNDNAPLKGKSITTEIIVGERIWFYNEEGTQITNLKVGQLDRK